MGIKVLERTSSELLKREENSVAQTELLGVSEPFYKCHVMSATSVTNMMLPLVLVGSPIVAFSGGSRNPH